MDKIQKLKNRIDTVVSLTDEELSMFSKAFVLKKISKNDFFLKEGQIANFIGLLNQGVLIYFKSMDNGDEITTDFAFEGDWVTAIQSRLSNSPSLINIKAIENSELLVIKQQDLSDIYIKIPKIERLGRILMEQAYLKMVEQNIDFQVFSAKDRYERLLKKHPQIFQRVQLYHIANYLGIDPKSLSRIRKQIFD